MCHSKPFRGELASFFFGGSHDGRNKDRTQISTSRGNHFRGVPQYGTVREGHRVLKLLHPDGDPGGVNPTSTIAKEDVRSARSEDEGTAGFTVVTETGKGGQSWHFQTSVSLN